MSGTAAELLLIFFGVVVLIGVVIGVLIKRLGWTSWPASAAVCVVFFVAATMTTFALYPSEPVDSTDDMPVLAPALVGAIVGTVIWLFNRRRRAN